MKKSNLPVDNVYDIVIVGGGPAGLTAGLYTARARLRVLLIEGIVTVSQITVSDLVENYPGISEISGFELNDRFKKQAVKFGLEVKSEQVESIQKEQLDDFSGWCIKTDNNEYKALAVIIATGAEWKNLGCSGEKKLLGKGVSYCATCDGPFYRDKDLVVVGGGDTAVQEAIFLTKFARKVTIIHRRERLRATGILRERIFANDKIDFIWDSVVEEVLGEDSVTGIKIKDVKTTDESRIIPADGIFIFIGLEPNTQLAAEVANLDEDGYIIADSCMKTSADGFFACGDCINKSFRQVITACGDGAIAAHSAELHVDELKGQVY